MLKSFYKIHSLIQKESFEMTAGIAFNTEDDIFKAHFPNSPIVPGVCILHIAKILMENLTEKRLFQNEIKNLKFLNVINPLENPEVTYKVKHQAIEGGVKANIVVAKDELVFSKLTVRYKFQ